MDPALTNISKQTEIPVSDLTSPKTRHPFHKTPIFLMSVFVLLVIAAFFGGTYYQAMSQKKEVAQITPTPILQVPSPTTDPMADWKTYISDRYQFSFKYPASAELTEETEKGQTNQDDTVITVSFNSGKLIITPNRFGMGVAPLKTQSVTIGGVPTTKYYITEDRGTYSEIAFPSGDNKIGFDFTLPKDSSMVFVDNTFDQIVKSFAFHPWGESDVDTWKTYQGTDVIFRYPTDFVVDERQSNYFVLVPQGITPAPQEGIAIDARLTGQKVDYDATLSQAESDLTNITKKSISGGIELSGQIGGGFGENTKIRVAIIKQGTGAIVIETADPRITVDFFDKVVSSFVYKK